MATYCTHCDVPYTNICDFCSFYCFNPKWRKSDRGWMAIYNDEGFCYVDMLPHDPEDECDEFYCFMVKRYGKREIK